jgi:hypothetical protein
MPRKGNCFDNAAMESFFAPHEQVCMGMIAQAPMGLGPPSSRSTGLSLLVGSPLMCEMAASHQMQD